ncbi:E3 ubiquitin-protein ligase rad18 [Orbilia ellipsospora]|uniref:Postreplication repair E3 ubiquitin-protein ligase RAD18 n=1 Tax=Orbilia ellipsospora TaxID=2528407 RepID=A0AAV9XRF4_9PEZI
MDDDFPDPTDWLKTSVPGLQALDTALACRVCKEYLNAPVVTSCGHTFCSLCIRRCLSSTQKCPACMTTDEESRLRRNPIVQEFLNSFIAVRKQMLELLAVKEEEEKPISPPEPMLEVEGRRVEKRSSIDFDDEIEEEEATDRRRGKRRKQEEAPMSSGELRRSTRSSSQRTNSKISSQKSMIVIDDSDDDFNPDQGNSDNETKPTPRSKRGRPARVPETPTKESGLVACPICNRSKTQDRIESHVNRCIEGRRSPSPPKAEDGAQASSASPLKRQPISFSNVSKPLAIQHRPPYTEEEKQKLRLPKGNFSLTKEADIRKKLRENGIRVDVKGKESKQVLWARLQEWTNIWNANLDSETPKTKLALVKELETNERHQQSQRPSIVQDKEFARDEWGKDHKDEFDALVAAAKLKAQKKKEQEKESTANGESAISQELPKITAEVNGIGSPEMIET